MTLLASQVSTALTSATSSLPETLLPLVIQIYQNLTGTQYSKDEQRRLQLLKDCYQQILGTVAPASWQLDAEHRPTHVLQKTSWSQHIVQQQQQKSHVHPLHYFIELGLDTIASYLDERAKRPWPLCGNKGDTIEQCFAELIHFLLNDMIGFKMDAIAIQCLSKRIQYLDKILNTEHLFLYGMLSYGKDKMNTLRLLRDILIDALSHTEQESHRTVARDKLETLQNEMESLLLNALHWLYYARQTNVHLEPLQLNHYMQNTSSNTPQATLYRQLRETHSGRIIHEVLIHIDARVFGAHHLVRTTATSPCEYFTTTGQPKTFLISQYKIDLPIWLMDQAQLEIENRQRLAAYIIALGEIKKMLDIAYELTGQAGDLWAYGDNLGKSSLNTLLILLENTLKTFFTLMIQMATFTQKKRDAYNAKHRKEPHENPNPNFYRAEEKFQRMLVLRTHLENIQHSILQQMQQFPDNAQQRIDHRKKELYRNLFQFIQLHIPVSQQRQFNFLQLYSHTSAQTSTQVEAVPDEVKAEVPTILREPQTRLPPLPNLSIFLTTGTVRHFTFQQTPNAHTLKKNIIRTYNDWVDLYFEHRKNIFSHYIRVIEALQTAIHLGETTDSLHTLLQAKVTLRLKQHMLDNMFEHFIQTLHAEEPRWRFQWRLWPIQTAGWPFNKRARTFAGTLKATLTNIQTRARNTCTQALIIFSRKIIYLNSAATTTQTDSTVTNATTNLQPLITFSDHCLTVFENTKKELPLQLKSSHLHQLLNIVSTAMTQKIYANIQRIIQHYKQHQLTLSIMRQKQCEFLHAILIFLQKPMLTLEEKEQYCYLVEQFFNVNIPLTQSPSTFFTSEKHHVQPTHTRNENVRTRKETFSE